MAKGAVLVDKYEGIPEGVLCTFCKKVTRGVRYFVGYRKGKEIHVHFSMDRHKAADMISYQPVLNLANREIKK